MTYPLVSVVVPTYRRPKLLERCLQALLSQHFPPEAYEVIIVDDGPQDPSTRILVSGWQQRLQARFAISIPPQPSLIPVKAVNGGGKPATLSIPVKTSAAQSLQIKYLAAEGTHGPAAARNLGWRNARGGIIAFTDDDCIPDPDWLSNGVSAFVDGIAGVSGRVMVPISSHPTDNEQNSTGLERSDFVTANCFYRKKVLEEVGGFDERFTTAWREDSDLYFTLLERKFPLAWEKGAIVIHPVRPEPWGISLRQQKKSFYNALLYKKHPQLYWRYIQPAPPWPYYAILAAVLVAAAGFLFGSLPLLTSGLGAWLFLMAALIHRRLKNTAHTPGHILEMVVTSLFIPFLSIYWRVRGSIHWKAFFL